MSKEIQNWWLQAQSDLVAAKDNLKLAHYDWACFLSQQAAEKALKALYLKQFQELKKIHDLSYFAKKLELPEVLLDACIELSKVYIQTRYPDVSNEIPAKRFSKQDAERSIQHATKVLQ